MKKVLIATVAAFTLTACGNSKVNWQDPAAAQTATTETAEPTVTEPTDEQRLHQFSARINLEGKPATAQTLLGNWCSVDSSEGKKAQFGSKGTFKLIKKDGSVQKSTYFVGMDGKLVIGGEQVKAIIVEDSATSTKILSLTTSATNVEIMEPCEAQKKRGGGDEKEESKDDSKDESEELPEAPKTT